MPKVDSLGYIPVADNMGLDLITTVTQLTPMLSDDNE